MTNVKAPDVIFKLVLGPVWFSLMNRRKLLPKNFHGCVYVFGRYPQNMPLFHRMVYSWWIIPLNMRAEKRQSEVRSKPNAMIVRTNVLMEDMVTRT